MLLLELHVCGLQRLTKRGLLETGVGHLEVAKVLPGKHAHGTVGQLAMLSADVGVGALALVAEGELDIAVVAVVAVTVGLSALVHQLDVEHATGTLSIVFGTRRGDDVDALHHGGRHRLRDL